VSQNYLRDRYAKSGERGFVMEIKPEIEETLNNALQLIEEERYPQAERLLDNVEAIDGDYYLLKFARGGLCARQGRLDKALEYFDAAIERSPYFMEAHFNKGMAHKEKLEMPKMVRSFRKALDLGDPENENVRWARDFLRRFEQHIREDEGVSLDAWLAAYDAFDSGVERMAGQQWQEAIAHFERCASLNPGSPKAYANIALCKAKLGCREEAIAMLDRAVELDPSYEPALVNRTVLASGAAMPDGAIPMIEYAKDYQTKKKSLILEAFRRDVGR